MYVRSRLRIFSQKLENPDMSYNGYGHPTPPAGGDLNHGIALRDVTIVTFTIAVFMLILRFLARILIVKKTGLDDYVMALATVVLPSSHPRESQKTKISHAYEANLGLCDITISFYPQVRCQRRRKASVLSLPTTTAGFD